MFIRLVSAALVAGFLASVVTTGLQLVLTSPLILKAETYEGQSAAREPERSISHIVPTHGVPPYIVPAHGGHADEHGDAPAADAEWQPAPGLARMAFTGLATLIGAVGSALVLGAVMLSLRRVPDPQTGLVLGVAGFLCVALAPAVGLPPELPGMGSAILELRQAWWVLTVLATAFGLYLVAERRTAPAISAGLVLILAPHVAGAPFVAEAQSRLPAAYAAQFAARSLAIGFVFWALLGLAYGWAWNLFGSDPTRRARG